MSAYLIERTPDINRAVLNDLVHNFRDRLGEVRVGKLGSETNRRRVTLCMSYMTRTDYLNVQYNQNLASHHWWSFNKIHIVLHYFKAISAQHYFARRLRFEVTAFHSHWDYFKHVWCLEPKLSTSLRWNSKEKIKQTGALIPKCHSTNCVWCSIIKVLNQSWGNDCFALCKWIICPCCGYLSSLHHIHM